MLNSHTMRLTSQLGLITGECLLQEGNELGESQEEEDAAWEPPDMPALEPQLAWMQVGQLFFA